jgi:hypothetical protein
VLKLNGAALRTQNLLLPLAIVALLIGLVRRIVIGWDAPLWFDETYTGSFATHRSFADLIDASLSELTGPVYYGLMWAWEKLAGSGNLALRAPSFLFALAAPLVVLFWGHPERRVRLLWAALIALWVPGFWFASEARSYGLLFFLGTLQAVFFIRMLQEPRLGRAAAWCAVSTLLILTHYHSLLLTGLQGVAYLAISRGAALRTWPAALLFAPAAAWMIVHIPIVMTFMRPDVAWQPILQPGQVRLLPELLFGGGRLATITFLIVAGSFAVDVFRWLRGREWPYSGYGLLAAGLSFAAILIVFAHGFFRPTFEPRYLVPFMPGMILGLALWVNRLGKISRLLPTAVLAFQIGVVLLNLVQSLRDPSNDFRTHFRWLFSAEEASRFLQERGAQRLFYIWDNPTAAILSEQGLARAGSFFFDRQGLPIPTRAFIIKPESPVQDPNHLLLTAANRPGDAILWMADPNIRNTRSVDYPPRIAESGPEWTCRDFGRERRIVLACIRGGPEGGAAR